LCSGSTYTEGQDAKDLKKPLGTLFGNKDPEKRRKLTYDQRSCQTLAKVVQIVQNSSIRLIR